MNKIRLTALTCIFFFSAALYAGEFAEIKSKIGDARDSAMTLIQNKDKRGNDQQKLVKDTAEAVSSALHKITPSAAKEAKFKELHDTWMTFKKVREEEVIPMVLAGKEDDARKLANGIQKERMQKMMKLCDELDK